MFNKAASTVSKIFCAPEHHLKANRDVAFCQLDVLLFNCLSRTFFPNELINYLI